MKKFFFIILGILLLPSLAILNGFNEMDGVVDDDPMTENQPERIKYRDTKYIECIDGSTARPDEIYCERMADAVNTSYTGLGFIQEVLYHGTYGTVPRFYHTPTETEEMSNRLEAERHAMRRGADGSTRFTGERVAEYEEKLDKLYEDDPVFLSKAQRCDPEGDMMKGLMKMRPGESVDQLHRGMDCRDWDK